MKTRTGISITEVALVLLNRIADKFGISRSAVLEIIIRDYAERNGFAKPEEAELCGN